MNYTEIAQRFNHENGRAMNYTEAWQEAKLICKATDCDMVEWAAISADLMAESVRLEERRKVEEVIEAFETYCAHRKEKGNSAMKNKTWNNLVFAFDKIKKIGESLKSE